MKQATLILSFLCGILCTISVILFFSFKEKEEPKKPVFSNHTPELFTVPTLPSRLSFADEAVPVSREDVKEKFDKEFLKIYFEPGTVIYLMKLAQKHFPVIEERLKANGVPEDFKYLCIAESNMQDWAVSKAGAVGFWQFMPATATGYSLEHNSLVDERRDLEKSTDAACKYFKTAYRKFGNWTAAAASFNCGMGGYNSRAVAQRSTHYFDLHLPEETNKYIHRILSFKYIFENAETLGYHVPDSLKYSPPATKELMVSSSAAGNLNDLAKKHGITYKELLWYNPWIKGYTLPSNKRSYTINVPAKN